MTGTTEITERRQTNPDLGYVQWTVNEFDDGKRYMLVATGAGVQFQAHFDAGQWGEFQKLVQPS